MRAWYVKMIIRKKLLSFHLLPYCATKHYDYDRVLGKRSVNTLFSMLLRESLYQNTFARLISLTECEPEHEKTIALEKQSTLLFICIPSSLPGITGFTRRLKGV